MIHWLCLVLCLSGLTAQKTILPDKITSKITIDGKLDEPAWQEAETYSDFITIRPNPGLTPKHDTEVKVLYNDHSLYVSAFMKDVSRDSIMTELVERDDVGNTDFFLVMIDTYQGGNEGNEFLLQSTGVQFDAIATANNEDENWDAVWFGAVDLREDGWYAEIEIPYSALRFAKKPVQEWNINFTRRRAASQVQTVWNPVDPEQNNPWLTQMGKIQNLKNIKPPLRLSFSPYASTYFVHSKDNNRDPINSTGYSYNAGMDVKWGINEAFTLDMTLIPDFGQVQSDDQVLNLSPFEVRFSENRPFFTEGTELFEKGDLFYSRRVGGRPINFYDVYNNLGDNETVTDNPINSQLYNATKISGRTGKGTGVGFFNAVSAASHATIENTVTGETREEMTSPLTNYNVFVVDQNLKNNSSISLTNTNVWRQGSEFYDANATAMTFDLKNKKQSIGISGEAAYSNQSFSDQDNNTGHSLELAVEKLAGNFTYGVYYSEESEHFNPNDLGFLSNANERYIGISGQYRRFDGFGFFNQFQSWFNLNHSRLHTPNLFASNHLNLGFWGQLKNFWNVNMWANYRPQSYNHFEPRVSGRFHINPANKNIGFWVGTDNRKKFRMSTFGFIYDMNEDGRWGYELGLQPRFRFSDKFNMSLGANLEKNFNSVGWVDFGSNDEIIYSQRDQTTVNNNINLTYTFNQKNTLDFRLRHYWSKVMHNQYHELNNEGLFNNTDYNTFKDLTFNSFTIDMVYRWRFAPGSDIFFVWKNNISGVHYDDTENYSNINYSSGVNRLSEFPQTNSLSFRIVYYLDYERITRK